MPLHGFLVTCADIDTYSAERQRCRICPTVLRTLRTSRVMQIDKHEALASSASLSIYMMLNIGVEENGFRDLKKHGIGSGDAATDPVKVRPVLDNVPVMVPLHV